MKTTIGHIRKLIREQSEKFVDMYGETDCDVCGRTFSPRATPDGIALDNTCRVCQGTNWDCRQCGKENDEDANVCQKCGLTKKAVNEHVGRARVSPQEVLATWEQLYVSSLQNRRSGDPHGVEPGKVSFEELVSWLQASEDAVMAALPKVGLVVDKDGDVVERGLSVPPPAK